MMRPPVQHLVRAGAIDSRTPQGFTPLSMALITRHYEAAGALIDAGARLTSSAAQLQSLVRRATL